jgi:hypothetical protein
MTPKKSDLGSKRLISLAPAAWVRWIMQRYDLDVAAIVSSEFQWNSFARSFERKQLTNVFGKFLI